MKSLVRRDTGQAYEEYLRQLAQAEGIENATKEQLARLDRKRKKKASNDDWTNPNDPSARITRMKDGRTKLAHKAEHAVDLASGALLAVTVQPADRGDTTSYAETLDAGAERGREGASAGDRRSRDGQGLSQQRGVGGPGRARDSQLCAGAGARPAPLAGPEARTTLRVREPAAGACGAVEAIAETARRVVRAKLRALL